MKRSIVSGRPFGRILSAACASVALLGVTHAQLDPVATAFGKIKLSIDGAGNNLPGGYDLQVEKPVGGTVVSAHFCAATYFGVPLPDGAMTLNGTPVNWDIKNFNPSGAQHDNGYADVTNIVKMTIDAAPAGIVNIPVLEGALTGSIDGSILAVIFDDPAETDDSTVILLFGHLDKAGAMFDINLAEPFDSGLNPLARMSLGISFGFQNGGGFGQFTIVDVNGERLSTYAGGEDDGLGENGSLITVGGIGDDPGNPADPFQNDGPFDYDDELYDLLPFIMDGDTVIQVATNNPSFDDNVFFGAFEISAIGAIGESILLTPIAAVNPTGTSHTVTATVVDDDSNPVVGRSVDFQILSGPHAGMMGNDVTDGAGEAQFTYVGTLTGTDTIVACMTNSGGAEQCSNEVEKTWTETCFTFDFSTEDDQVTPLVNGQHINSEFGTIFTLSSSGPNAGLGIFDSTPGGPNDPSQDRDLLVDTGNILILQTENFPPDGNDVFPRPNDDEDGGTITAAFAMSVEPTSLRLIDLDTDGCSVTLTDSSGRQRTYDVPPGWTGDLLVAGPGQGLLDLTMLAPQPGFASVATAAEDVGFDGLDVVQIDVELTGSGALDDLTVCAGSVPMARCEPRNGAGINPMRLTSDELPVLGTSWHADLDCSGFPGGVARLEVRRLATQGVNIPMGELLVAGDLVYTTSAAQTGGLTELGWSIPFDLSLMGVEVHAQGVCMGTLSRKIARATLSNALDLTLGF